MKKKIIKYITSDVIIGFSEKNLMLGSSSIERLDHKRLINCGNWLNRGIGGAKISDILFYVRLTPLGINPDRIIIYAGENDIVEGLSIDETIDNYKTLLEFLFKKYPDSQYHVIAIKPSPNRHFYWEHFDSVNKEIGNFILGHANAQFLSPGWGVGTNTFHLNFINDGVHLSRRGYSLFIGKINESCW